MTVRKDEIHVATLRELAEARAEIARLTAERDQAVTHRAATNKEIKRLHAVIKSKGFSVEDSIALHETRSEIARLTAELAAARAVPGDVEAAIEAHEAAICWLCQNDPVRAGHGATIRTAIARAISEAADARGTVGGLLATAPRPQCPTHGDTVNCYCATGALHCHDCGHTPHFCTACDGYHDAGACPLPKGG